jgi:superfamily II DNA/RNA helicase
MLGIGGLDFQEDCKKYREKHAHIVVGSVGRLWELMRNRVLVIGGKMSLVLDEGDKLFGSKDEKFRQILEMLPRESRWIVFSATYSRNVLEELVRNKKFIYIQTMLKNNELEVIINNEME